MAKHTDINSNIICFLHFEWPTRQGGSVDVSEPAFLHLPRVILPRASLELEDLFLLLHLLGDLDVLAAVLLLIIGGGDLVAPCLLDDQLHVVDTLAQSGVDGDFDRVDVVFEELAEADELAQR